MEESKKLKEIKRLIWKCINESVAVTTTNCADSIRSSVAIRIEGYGISPEFKRNIFRVLDVIFKLLNTLYTASFIFIVFLLLFKTNLYYVGNPFRFDTWWYLWNSNFVVTVSGHKYFPIYFDKKFLSVDFLRTCVISHIFMFYYCTLSHIKVYRTVELDVLNCDHVIEPIPPFEEYYVCNRNLGLLKPLLLTSVRSNEKFEFFQEESCNSIDRNKKFQFLREVSLVNSIDSSKEFEFFQKESSENAIDKNKEFEFFLEGSSENSTDANENENEFLAEKFEFLEEESSVNSIDSNEKFEFLQDESSENSIDSNEEFEFLQEDSSVNSVDINKKFECHSPADTKYFLNTSWPFEDADLGTVKAEGKTFQIAAAQAKIKLQSVSLQLKQSIENLQMQKSKLLLEIWVLEENLRVPHAYIANGP